MNAPVIGGSSLASTADRARLLAAEAMDSGEHAEHTVPAETRRLTPGRIPIQRAYDEHQRQFFTRWREQKRGQRSETTLFACFSCAVAGAKQ